MPMNPKLVEPIQMPKLPIRRVESRQFWDLFLARDERIDDGLREAQRLFETAQ